MIKGLDYPPKILVAFAEAIAGNGKIRDWLIKNGYRELGLFSFALRNMDEARVWLMENGFPHLLALINAIEGNQQALSWLQTHKFDDLMLMGLAADGHEAAMKSLLQKDKILGMLALKIEFVKDEIERENNDVHKISPL